MIGKIALVTGAHGFIGRHVARAIAYQGYEVRAIGHGTWGRDEWRQWGISEWHPADVTIDSLITYAGEPDLIVHCAGSGSVAFSMSHPYQDYQRTVATTHSVLEYIRTIRPDTTLVCPSSAGVYGFATTMPIKPDATLNPVSPYGVHKKIAEDLCRCYGKHFGVRSALVRFFSIYGVGLRKQLIWDACTKIAAGGLTFNGTGEETRDWLHVEDASSLMIHAARYANTHCPVVNGGTGQALTISTVVSAIAEEIGAPRPTFSGIVRPGDPPHYRADISDAIAWGWDPARDWREEIRTYVRWFKAGAQ